MILHATKARADNENSAVVKRYTNKLEHEPLLRICKAHLLCCWLSIIK